ncbi:pyrroloquinoline quinone-dependent dehydrogenase [Pendulispora brunnea]|uniref:Pyrroloquinoline quinone-dependent dehydrogenase n=1 Tax=Pendulispora brunnea TaxID=2905690 RepID=A0ABZ2KH64_9BACT
MTFRNMACTLCMGAVALGVGSSCREASLESPEDAISKHEASLVAEGEWPGYGRDPGGARHSPLAQIDRSNAARLQPAWTYRTGDLAQGIFQPNKSTFQATPIYLWNTLYVSTGFNRVLALDPESGKPRWTFDPGVDITVPRPTGLTSRGVSAWEDAAAPDSSPCKRRIFLGTLDARLIALDAMTGARCTGFGQNGSADLTTGLANVTPGRYGVTSPPAIVNGVVVVGSIVLDGTGVDVPSGVVRAFDARTGAERWRWDPIPRTPSEPGYEAWSPEEVARAGAGNVWSLMAVDAERDLVFLPTSSPAPDYYGGLRKGPGPHANSLVALRASTGALVWAYQVVHHDIWDYDIASPPLLTTIPHDGGAIQAVAVATKPGHLFFLNRDTGTPIFPVEERPVPASDVPGEAASPTQPFPSVTPNLVGDTHISPDDAFGLTLLDRQYCRGLLANARSEGLFTPASRGSSIQFPGPIGGAHWGGMAVDEARGLLITSVNRVADIVRVIPRNELYIPLPGEMIYEQVGTPYKVGRRVPRGLEIGFPCTPPPWGKLVAVDLASGGIRWDVPIGQFAEAKLIPGSERWGSMLLGGPIVTDGGLVIVAGTMDDRIRIFDIETGKELWRADLPAGGQATPMTYRAPSGKQFVVIAAGGSTYLSRPPGDYLVAFALP